MAMTKDDDDEEDEDYDDNDNGDDEIDGALEKSLKTGRYSSLKKILTEKKGTIERKREKGRKEKEKEKRQRKSRSFFALQNCLRIHRKSRKLRRTKNTISLSRH